MEISRDGHRARMRAAYLQGGGDAMPDHQLLELLLSISIPRKDVSSANSWRFSGRRAHTRLCSLLFSISALCFVIADSFPKPYAAGSVKDIFPQA